MESSAMHAPSCVNKWVKGRFVLRSGFYAGRGVSAGDLNSDILEMFYQGIKTDLGDQYAVNFVRFVNQLRDLSASAFIVAFERFWASDCSLVAAHQVPEDRNQLSGRGDALIGEAYGLLAATIGGGNRQSEVVIEQESFFIKMEFIRRHWKEVPADEKFERKPSQRSNGYFG